jgi:hypothetical protein
MSTRVPYLAGLLGGSRPTRPQDTSLQPPRRLFAPELPFAQGLPLEARSSTPTPAQATAETLAPGTLTAGPAAGAATGANLMRGGPLSAAMTPGSASTRAESRSLHSTRSHEDPHSRDQEQPGWTAGGQPGAGVRPPWTAAGDAPGAHGERNRPAGPASGDPRSLTSLAPRRPGELAPPRPFAAQSGEPASSDAGRAGSEPHTETSAGVARSPTGGHPSVAESDAVSAALALATAARGLVGPDRREPRANSPALALSAARSAARDPSSPGFTAGAHAGEEGVRDPTSEAESRPGSPIPAPAADRLADWLGLRALSSDLPPGAESKQRGASARVSIGTIEVTVAPPPAPVPPVAAGIGRPAAQPSNRASPGSGRPVADQLRLGARRWYGMAQA